MKNETDFIRFVMANPELSEEAIIVRRGDWVIRESHKSLVIEKLSTKEKIYFTWGRKADYYKEQLLFAKTILERAQSYSTRLIINAREKVIWIQHLSPAELTPEEMVAVGKAIRNCAVIRPSIILVNKP